MVKSDNCAVGYKQPPRHAQFKPGQSGNPAGRPKKTTTFEDALQKELLALVTVVQEGGKRQKISKQVAIVRQQVNNAARGDFRAAKWLSQLALQLKSSEGGSLEELIQTMRDRHAQLDAVERNRTKPKNKPRVKRLRDASGSSTPRAGSQ
jgi:hypothetical protein